MVPNLQTPDTPSDKPADTTHAETVAKVMAARGIYALMPFMCIIWQRRQAALALVAHKRHHRVAEDPT